MIRIISATAMSIETGPAFEQLKSISILAIKWEQACRIEIREQETVSLVPRTKIEALCHHLEHLERAAVLQIQNRVQNVITVNY